MSQTSASSNQDGSVEPTPESTFSRFERLLGKRFVGLWYVSAVITAGYFLGPAATFTIFAGTLSSMYGIYAAGQSWTDKK